jgi:hypothetical protein
MMIETNFFILDVQQFTELKSEADELGVSLDYYLMEFCIVDGEMVEYDGNNWVSVSN